MSSSGKGRLSVGKNKYLFSYDSLNETKEGMWSLAFDLPLHGEELLQLNWSNALKEEKVSLDGEFYRRLLALTASRQSLRALMQMFLLKTAQVIAAQDAMGKNPKAFECLQDSFDSYKDQYAGSCANKAGGFQFDWSSDKNKFVTQVVIAKHYLYTMSFENVDAGHFGRIEAILAQKKNNRKLFTLKLFLSSCRPEEKAEHL